MWRVCVVYFNPKTELEDWACFDFMSDLEAWRFHELVFKSNNVNSVTKPFKI